MSAENREQKYHPLSAGDTVSGRGGQLTCDPLSNSGQIRCRTGVSPFDGLLRDFARNGKTAHRRKLLHLGGVKVNGLRIALFHNFYYNPFL
jgi:hypothetical protein